ncbi:hypothetical protein FQN57_006922 [Myotisia sp. PD_48]|nr:hypothetical protein FQN57_006922 [Myotisia sp. PD_48]
MQESAQGSRETQSSYASYQADEEKGFNIMFLTRSTRRGLLIRQVFNSQIILPSIQYRASHTNSTTLPPPIHSKWLSSIKSRVGKCIMFGLKPDQVAIAGRILEEVAQDWRELIAGSEGFLTGPLRRGLFRHNVVWGEMDVMSSMLSDWNKAHVNNVMYIRYAETGRINWTRNFAVHLDPKHKKEWLELIGNTGIGFILKSIKVDYKFPMTSPDQITVYHRLANRPPFPSSSDPEKYSNMNLEVMILSEAKQRPAARCEEDIVLYDYRIGRKVSKLPHFMLDQFRKTWELQEESKWAYRLRAQAIERKLRSLETDSWDREDAVEDMGSAVSR